MKNLNLIKFVMLFCMIQLVQNISFAQDKESFFRIGAKAGVNVNKIDGKSYNNGFNYNFQAGVFTQFNFSKTFGIQPEVNFVQSESEYNDDANIIYDDLVGGGTQHKAKLDYLEIPVLLNINIGPTKRVKLQLGPSYGGLLKQTTDSLRNGVQNLYKNGEWSAIGGLWIQLPFINLSARYKLGLTDISNLSTNQSWKNQAIQVSVGVTF
jgi:Outer membrane protein beta-barrel domain